MFYKTFSFQIILRVAALFATLALLIYLILNTQLWFSITGLILIAAGEIAGMIAYINRIMGDVNRFVDAVKHQDHSMIFSARKKAGSFQQLYESFNEILTVQKNISIEKESIFQLFKIILEKVKFGVIVIPSDALTEQHERYEIIFMNEAASELINVPQFKYWHRLAKHSADFVSVVTSIRSGGKRFIEMLVNGRRMQLSVEVLPLRLFTTDYLVISFQNIKDEVEQKEMEAWNKLINVLSHEILNSITPISSLTETVKQMIGHIQEGFDQEQMEDIQAAVNTIKKRTDGLMEFVKDYRLVAELPSPRLQAVSVRELLKNVKVLMSPSVAQKHILFRMGEVSQRDMLQMDGKLIEQVLINLIGNSMYALQNTSQPVIALSARRSAEYFFIEVSDNGKGIPKENLDKIFIPFFTTRENGSGIGLTISRNIMKIHGGNLEVASVEGEGATFSLVFRV